MDSDDAKYYEEPECLKHTGSNYQKISIITHLLHTNRLNYIQNLNILYTTIY